MGVILSHLKLKNLDLHLGIVDFFTCKVLFHFEMKWIAFSLKGYNKI